VGGNGAGGAIELRVDEITQLFDTLDPFPFRERDLDKDAEEYIVGWAREFPRDRPLRIVVHCPVEEAQPPRARELGAAFSRYFTYRQQVISRELGELFRIGRRSLAIGVVILMICLGSAHVIGTYLGDSPIRRLAEESFILLGWVANWRPLEIFLYEWWPITRRRDLYRRLAAASVEVIADGDMKAA
jgi:hypothetical protein